MNPLLLRYVGVVALLASTAIRAQDTSIYASTANSTPVDQAETSGQLPDMNGLQHENGEMSALSGMQHAEHGQATKSDINPSSENSANHGGGVVSASETDHFGDRDFPVDDMARAREAMMNDSGGGQVGLVFLNLLDYQLHSGRDGYRWDGEGYYGGDINRFWFKSEGEGELARGLDSGEVQALYSRAIDAYFNLQAGIRQDFGRGPNRTHATLGFEGLAPGFFEVEGALFVSTDGDLLGRVEGFIDQRLTQRLILQPRLELNLAAQDEPENDIGSGLVNVEFGVRLRYEFSRQFAPYIGVSYLRKIGDTASLSRRAGEDVHAASLVAGLRIWF